MSIFSSGYSTSMHLTILQTVPHQHSFAHTIALNSNALASYRVENSSWCLLRPSRVNLWHFRYLLSAKLRQMRISSVSAFSAKNRQALERSGSPGVAPSAREHSGVLQSKQDFLEHYTRERFRVPRSAPESSGFLLSCKIPQWRASASKYIVVFKHQ